MKTSNMPPGLRNYWNRVKSAGSSAGKKAKGTARRYASAATKVVRGGTSRARSAISRNKGGLLGHVKTLAIATPVAAAGQATTMMIVNKVPEIGGSFWYSNAVDAGVGLLGYVAGAAMGQPTVGMAWYLGTMSNAFARTNYRLAKKAGLLGLGGYASPQYLPNEEAIVLNALRSGGMGNILAVNDDQRGARLAS